MIRAVRKRDSKAVNYKKDGIQQHEIPTFGQDECYCKIVVDDFIYRGADLSWPIVDHYSKYSLSGRCVCNLCNHVYYIERLRRQRKEFLKSFNLDNSKGCPEQGTLYFL